MPLLSFPLRQQQQENLTSFFFFPYLLSPPLELQSHELSMTNLCKAFSSGSLCSWEASGRMSQGRAGSTSPDSLGHCSPSSVTSPSCGAPYGDGGYQSSSYLSIDGRLLAPVHLDIDTDFHAVREQEKEDIKLLNNQFVTLIEKVWGAAAVW